MISPETILGLPFLKKSRFTGSEGGMRYCVSKKEMTDPEDENKKENRLEAACCPGPFSIDRTKPELFKSCLFPFSEEGRLAAVEWLNGQYRENEELYRDIAAHPERYGSNHILPNS